MTATRIYHKVDKLTGRQRLVRASRNESAVRHSSTHITAEVASQEVLVDLLSRGVIVETAGEEPQSELAIDPGHEAGPE